MVLIESSLQCSAECVRSSGMRHFLGWLLMVMISLLVVTLQTASAEDCTKATALYNRALDTQALRQRERLLRKALPLCSQPEVFARLYNNLADTYEKQNRLSLALRFYRQALRAKPDLATAYFSVGDIFNRLGDYQSAAIMYGKGLRYQPSDEDAEKKRDAEVKARRRMVIYFSHDSFKLPVVYLSRLDIIGDAVVQDHGSRIQVIGHTCDLGSHSYNRKLSLKRAQEVAAYLAEHFGVTPARVEVLWKGESEGVLPGRDKESRELNRCAEILLTR